MKIATRYFDFLISYKKLKNHKELKNQNTAYFLHIVGDGFFFA